MMMFLKIDEVAGKSLLFRLTAVSLPNNAFTVIITRQIDEVLYQN